ncbi:lytic transglycosylase domain-containing protein [Planococcus sp. N028]|uniref:Lytic transglycosylase domain-containing protein n=1 Tax=Planococcus shixiaomingii TaxID=3058393 RepID=A0ABT8MYM0_9BACL|nr:MULTISPECIES: lytic transglycosylase domain-containing protein [unclassified Planococcus (in: firmicutes)]MDN7240548.1 lytic transglycosylase domain-containing protein [Planococcus sp. N028]WKA56441.1 lytic transglycosylase domain-containing protein [Planococcus sp. N022]
MKKKKYTKRIRWKRVLLALLLIPGTLVLATILIVVFYVMKPPDLIETLKKTPNHLFEMEVPAEYIPLYKEAAGKYEVPWTLLAAHHRVETRFSTMDPLLSPVGAEGHMQFMPCTFVGWTYPSCSGLGKGDIPEEEKTDPAVISAYGGYGVDGNEDGKADPYDLTDALYSAANYLSKNGAADGDLEKAIFQYNHSDQYVQDILHYYNQYEKEFNDK